MAAQRQAALYDVPVIDRKSENRRGSAIDYRKYFDEHGPKGEGFLYRPIKKIKSKQQYATTRQSFCPNAWR
ncbi:hypothetical protein HV425_14435 [Enterococcus faecium]|nr:hypothetical protein [Enterococcus faecium]NVF26321.1 hypothetical protein [Enterococcus faecium]